MKNNHSSASSLSIQKKQHTNTEAPTRKGYKQTALGLIPEDWEVKKLGEITQNFKSGEGITSSRIFTEGDFPVYGGNGLRGYTNKYTHDGEYLLIGRQGALCGNITLVNGQNYISEHAIAVSTNGSTNLYWLGYHLHYLNLNRLSESSAQPGLAVNKLIKLKVVSPPLPEQRRIAALLSTWDRAIRKTQQLLAQLQQRNKGLMQQLLTGKKRLREFSGEWKSYTFKELLKKVKRPINWNDEELYKLISVRRRSGGIFFRDALYGQQIKVKNLNTAKTGDFLFSKMQIVHGASALVTDEFNNMKISGSYISVKSKNESVLQIDFLNWYSKLPVFYHQTYVSSYGVHIEKMTFDFSLFILEKILIPKVAEQKAIVNILENADREVKLYEQKLATLQQQKKGLMQVLLTGEKRLTNN